jgi:hypothetical protein
LLLSVLLLPLPGRSGEPAPPEAEASENYCHDPASWAKYDELLKQAPHDALIVRSYALRLGLCRMVDEGKVSLEYAIEVFDTEKFRMLLQRTRGTEDEKRPKPAPADERDSRG